MRNENLLKLSAREVGSKGMAANRRGDGATLKACIAELRTRRTNVARVVLGELRELNSPSKKIAAPANAKRRTAAGPMAAQVKRVAEIAEGFSSDGGGDRSVYVILLQRGADFGFYVGKTGKDIDERYWDHKDGHKASKYVEKYGVRPLKNVGSHLRGTLSEDAALKIEKQLATRLRREKFWVEGGH